MGDQWPLTTNQWGASGFYINIPGYPPDYTAAIGSISRMQNLALTNTLSISCQYVDTDLTTLNTKG